MFLFYKRYKTQTTLTQFFFLAWKPLHTRNLRYFSYVCGFNYARIIILAYFKSLQFGLTVSKLKTIIRIPFQISLHYVLKYMYCGFYYIALQSMGNKVIIMSDEINSLKKITSDFTSYSMGIVIPSIPRLWEKIVMIEYMVYIRVK